MSKYFKQVERDKNFQIIGFTADSAYIFNEKGVLLHQLDLPDGLLLNGKWVVSNINRNRVWHIDLGWVNIPGNAVYDFQAVAEGLMVLDVHNGYSLMNDSGKIVIEHADQILDRFFGKDSWFDMEEDLSDSSKGKKKSTPYQKGALLGWAMTDGSHTEPAIYERIAATNCGTLVVQKNLLLGLVNEQGKVLIPIEYTGEKMIYWGSSLVLFFKKGLYWYLFDARTGKQLMHKKLLSGAFDISTGLPWGLTAAGWQVFNSTTGNPILPAPVLKEEQGCYNGYVYKKNKKYGVIGLDGKVLVPFEWDTISNCSNPPWGSKSGKITAWSNGFVLQFETKGAELRIIDHFLTVRRDSLWYALQPDGSIFPLNGYTEFLNISGTVGHSHHNRWDIFGASGQVRATLTADTLLPYSEGFIEVKNGPEHYIYQLSSGKKIPFRYEKIMNAFSFFITENNHKRGIADLNLQEILPCKYSNIRLFGSDFGGDFIETSTSDSIGLYYKDGSVCIPEDKYEEYGTWVYKDDYFVKKNGITHHYSLSKRQWASPGSELEFYKKAPVQLTQDLFKIQVNGLYGIVDQYNQTVIRPEYTSIEKYSRSKIVILKKGDKYQRFNPITRQLDPKLYDDMRIGVNNFALLKEGKADYWYKNHQLIFKKDSQELMLLRGEMLRFMDPVTHLYGVMDTAGRILQEAEYKSFGYYDYDSKIITANKGGKYGALNSDLQIIIPFEYSRFEVIRRVGYLFFKGNKMGFYDQYGAQILAPEFDNIKMGENATHFVAVVNGQYRFYNQKGQLLHNTTWEDADTYVGGLAPVKKEGRWGYIDVTGQGIVPFEYQYASKFRSFLQKNDALVLKNHQYHVIDIDGRFMDKISLKDIFSTDSGDPFKPKLKIESSINTRAYTEIPFEKVGSGNGYLVAKSEDSGKVGLVDFLGEWAILPQYMDIQMNDYFRYTQALACVFNGTKWALLGRDLQLIGDFQYDSIAQLGDGLFLVKKGKNAFKINEKGAVVR